MSGRDILLRARAQFRTSRTVESLRSIEVPEWGATIRFWPARSMDEKQFVGRHIRVGGDHTAADLVRFHAANVCARARNEHGERLWTDDDEPALLDTDPEVLERVSLAMGLTGPSIEDAEKN